MNYELFDYRQIFYQATKNAKTANPEIDVLTSVIKQESDRILTALQSNTANMEAAKIQQYIQQHQQALHIMLEDLDKKSPPEIPGRKKETREIIQSSLENLLIDLQKYFPVHFNHQSILPSYLSDKASAVIEQKSAQLIKVFASRKNPKQPINNLEDILKEIITKHRSMTYAQKTYMESFLDTLTDQLEKIEAGIEVLDIILRVISLNYNHPLFYDFCYRYFSSEVDRCEELSAQCTIMNYIKKSINQTSPLTGQHYSPDLPSIQDSLLKFISSELDYLNSMDSIGAHLHQHGLLDDRYKVTLTVRQLAIFIHLQVEANIIVAETPKLLHEYIAKHYRTNETDRISAKSFKNAYYSASTEDLEKVIDKIVTMLSLAQEKL